MINATIDTKKLAYSVKYWSKEFGETNEVALAKLSAEVCRALAAKSQPYGTGMKARNKIVAAIAKDVRKSVRTVDNDYFNKLLSRERRSVKWRGQWVQIPVDRLILHPSRLDSHVESLRKSTNGKVDGRQITKGNLLVAPEDVVRQVIEARAEKAGIAKGAWILAGRELTEMARRGPATAAAMKRQGIGPRYMGWAQKAARESGTRGFATMIKNLWSPKMDIKNKARHSGKPRILGSKQVKQAITNGFRKMIRNYEQAFHAMDKRNHSK